MGPRDGSRPLLRAAFYVAFAPDSEPVLVSQERVSEPLPKWAEEIMRGLMKGCLGSVEAYILGRAGHQLTWRSVAEDLGMPTPQVLMHLRDAAHMLGGRLGEFLIATPAEHRPELLLLLAETSPMLARRVLATFSTQWTRTRDDVVPFLESEVRGVRELGLEMLARVPTARRRI